MTREDLLDRYRSGYSAVAEAVAALGDDDLDRNPATGEWTPRMVLHHLADSEATAYVRLRRLIAEDNPPIVGYNEAEFARRLHYDRPIDAALEVLHSVRLASLELLETLTPEEWNRAGTHSESGRYSVDDWLRIYAEHPHEHAQQMG